MFASQSNIYIECSFRSQRDECAGINGCSFEELRTRGNGSEPPNERRTSDARIASRLTVTVVQHAQNRTATTMYTPTPPKT